MKSHYFANRFSRAQKNHVQEKLRDTQSRKRLAGGKTRVQLADAKIFLRKGAAGLPTQRRKIKKCDSKACVTTRCNAPKSACNEPVLLFLGRFSSKPKEEI